MNVTTYSNNEFDRLKGLSGRAISTWLFLKDQYRRHCEVERILPANGNFPDLSGCYLTSVNTLTAQLGFSKSTVYKSIGQLQDAKLIEFTPLMKADGSFNNSKGYIVVRDFAIDTLDVPF